MGLEHLTLKTTEMIQSESAMRVSDGICWYVDRAIYTLLCLEKMHSSKHRYQPDVARTRMIQFVIVVVVVAVVVGDGVGDGDGGDGGAYHSSGGSDGGS